MRSDPRYLKRTPMVSYLAGRPKDSSLLRLMDLITYQGEL